MDAANTVTNTDGIGTPPAGLAALRSSFTYAQFDNLVINSSQPFAFPHALFDKHLLVPPRPSPRVDQDPAVPRSDFNGLVGCRFRVGTTPLVADALARFAGLSNGSHELSILDGTTFLVVARATLDLAGGGDLNGFAWSTPPLSPPGHSRRGHAVLALELRVESLVGCLLRPEHVGAGAPRPLERLAYADLVPTAT